MDETIPEMWDRINNMTGHIDDAEYFAVMRATERMHSRDGLSPSTDWIEVVFKYGFKIHNLGRPVPLEDGSVRFDESAWVLDDS